MTTVFSFKLRLHLFNSYNGKLVCKRWIKPSRNKTFLCSKLRLYELLKVVLESTHGLADCATATTGVGWNELRGKSSIENLHKNRSIPSQYLEAHLYTYIEESKTSSYSYYMYVSSGRRKRNPNHVNYAEICIIEASLWSSTWKASKIYVMKKYPAAS